MFVYRDDFIMNGDEVSFACLRLVPGTVSPDLVPCTSRVLVVPVPSPLHKRFAVPGYGVLRGLKHNCIFISLLVCAMELVAFAKQ